MRKPPPYNKKVNPISFMISPVTTFTDEEIALNYLEELLEEGEDRSEMEAFIEEHGHKNFYDHFDEYRDCLLYTSPSPRDRTRSRMPSSA